MRNILKAVIVAAVSSHSVLADTYTWSAAASGDFETLSSNVPYKLNLRAGGDVTVASGAIIWPAGMSLSVK